MQAEEAAERAYREQLLTVLTPERRVLGKVL
jgi:hypothetical protein